MSNIDKLIKGLEDRSTSVRELVELDVRAVEPLIEVLKHKKFDFNCPICKHTTVQSDTPVKCEECEYNLTYNHWQTPPWERKLRGAVQILGEIGDGRAVEPLIDLLKHKTSFIREKAAEALSNIGDVRAVEPLIDVINLKSYVTGKAAEALGKFGDVRAVEPLIEVLKKSISLEVKNGVIEALVYLNDVRAVEPLIELLKNKHDREKVAEALGKFGDVRAVEPLIELLKGDDNEFVLDALGKLGDKRAIEPLIDIVSKDNWVFWPSVYALKNIDKGLVVELLIDELKKSNYPENVLRALLEIDEESVVELLIDILDNGTHKKIGLNKKEMIILELGRAYSSKFYNQRKGKYNERLNLDKDENFIRIIEMLNDLLKDNEFGENAAIILENFYSSLAIEPLINALDRFRTKWKWTDRGYGSQATNRAERFEQRIVTLQTEMYSEQIYSLTKEIIKNKNQ